MVESSKAWMGYFCVAMAALLWASSGVAGKGLLVSGVSVMELVQARITLATLLLGMALGLGARGLLGIRLRDLPYLFLVGLFMALNNATYFYAISRIQVAAAILLQYLAPVLVAVYAMFFWKERASLAKGMALALALGGCYLVVGGYSLELLGMNQDGILGGLGAAICFAVYTLLGEKGMHRYTPWTVLFYASFFASIIWHLLAEPFQYLRGGLDIHHWVWLLYIALMGTVLPFGLYFLGVNYIRSTRAIITATLEPISAAGISLVFLGETLEWLQVLGGVLVIMAVTALQLDREGQGLTPEIIRVGSRS